jgi:TonB-dependent receptor
MGRLVAMTGLMTAAASQHALAQAIAPSRPPLHVASSPLDRALRTFARQSGRQVAYAPKLVRGKTASSVKGITDPTRALERLLAGTGLSFRSTPSGYVLIPALTVVPSVRRVQLADGLVVPTSPERDIVVVGTRLDGREAADVKRRSLQSVSVLTEAEIRNVPDTSLADIVRRIPGMQLSVRAGGGIVTIRGLSQTEDRLNGRNLTSTVFRGFDIAALPADIVTGIDVYKSPSASQIEGGIGGVIDFHTRRPFDENGSNGSVTAKAAYGDLDGTLRPHVSGHFGVRGSTPVGDLGILIGGSHQAQDVAGDIFRTETNVAQTTTSGEVIDAPADAAKRYLRGTKTLSTGYGSVQWRPSSALEVTGDLLYNRSALDFTNTSLRAILSAARTGNPIARSSSGGIVQSGRWTAVPLEASTSRGIGHLDAQQYGVNARYRRGPLTVLADASITGTRFRYGTAELSLRTSAPELLYTLGEYPRFTVTGLDPADAHNWRVGDYGDVRVDDDARETAARLDAVYEIGGLLRSLKAGTRIARRTLEHRLAVRSVEARSAVDPVEAVAYFALSRNRLFTGDYPQPQWIAPAATVLSHDQVGSVRAAFGFGSAQPRFQPEYGYSLAETTVNAYAEMTFDIPVPGLAIQGNSGVRYVGTSLSVDSLAPTRTNHRNQDDDWLPSINLRSELTGQLYLRLAWSRQITRPALTQLAPVITVDFVNAVGDAGNPTLKPLRASQYDAALEWYFGRGGNLYAAAFYKKVEGFISARATPEVIDGKPFLISRPANADNGWIGGIEIGYAQKFDILPGLLAGLGAQASYTYIDSFRQDNGAGYRVPLEQMSRNNYSVAATYDRAGITAGVTWIWRSRLLELSRGDASGRPLFRNPYGQLDGSISIALTSRLSVNAGVINLLQRRTTEYHQDRQRLNQVFVESRRILIGLTLRSRGPK